MKKTTRLLLLLTVTAAIFTGCGKNTANDSRSDPTASDVRPTESGAGHGRQNAGPDDARTAEIAGLLENAKVGDTFTFGTLEQDGNAGNGAEPITWVVLRQDVGKALVISEKVLAYMPFKQGTDADQYPKCLYKDSDLRSYLNGEFYHGAFSDAEKAMILTARIMTPYRDEQYNDLQYETDDPVFVLSRDEAARYVSGVGTLVFGLPTTLVKEENPYEMNSISGVPGVEKAMPWWLRDMGGDSSKYAAYVPATTEQRRTFDKAVYDRLGVRPSFWIVYNEEDANGYANGTVQPKADEALDAGIASLKVGDKLTFGVYDKNPYNMDGYETLSWTVLDEDDEGFLILSDDYVGRSVFTGKTENGEKPDETCWAESYLRTYINSDAYTEFLFTPQEKAKLLLTHVVSTGYGNRGGGAETDDRLFVPDVSEIEKYLDSSGRKIGYKYWLRSQDSWAPYIAYVNAGGSQYSSDPTEELGIRLMARVKK